MKLINAILPVPARSLACSLALLAALVAGAPAQAESQPRFGYSGDGSHVTDAKTGLTWQRCSLGQSWDKGTCTGTASQHTEKQATALGQALAGWRLPTVKELATLIDTSKGIPTIDGQAFPATPAGWFYTASPYLGSASLAWFVSFEHGHSSPLSHDQRQHIRLVHK